MFSQKLLSNVLKFILLACVAIVTVLLVSQLGSSLASQPFISPPPDVPAGYKIIFLGDSRAPFAGAARDVLSAEMINDFNNSSIARLSADAVLIDKTVINAVDLADLTALYRQGVVMVGLNLDPEYMATVANSPCKVTELTDSVKEVSSGSYYILLVNAIAAENEQDIQAIQAAEQKCVKGAIDGIRGTTHIYQASIVNPITDDSEFNLFAYEVVDAIRTAREVHSMISNK